MYNIKGEAHLNTNQPITILSKLSIGLFLLAFLIAGCQNYISQEASSVIDKGRQQAIIDKYFVDSARQYSYNSKEWQKYIDMGLSKDSTNAIYELYPYQLKLSNYGLQ